MNANDAACRRKRYIVLTGEAEEGSLPKKLRPYGDEPTATENLRWARSDYQAAVRHSPDDVAMLACWDGCSADLLAWSGPICRDIMNILPLIEAIAHKVDHAD